MDLREMGIDGRTGFSWLRIGPVGAFVNVVMNLRVP
jgi:hypothetical protein